MLFASVIVKKLSPAAGLFVCRGSAGYCIISFSAEQESVLPCQTEPRCRWLNIVEIEIGSQVPKCFCSLASAKSLLLVDEVQSIRLLQQPLVS